MDRSPHVCACGEHGFVSLTQGKTTFFDPEYCEVVGLSTWFAKFDGRNWYACRSLHQLIDDRMVAVTIRLHSIVLPSIGSFLPDHIDGDSLNNRRSNLRLATSGENSANQKKRAGASSRYRGVSRAGKYWRAVIGWEGKQSYLGKFNSEEEAARAYDVASVRLHGSFGRVNFPIERGGA